MKGEMRLSCESPVSARVSYQGGEGVFVDRCMRELVPSFFSFAF